MGEKFNQAYGSDQYYLYCQRYPTNLKGEVDIA